MADRPKRGLPGGGWLSMAPSDEAQSQPAASSSSSTSSPRRSSIPKRATFQVGADTSTINTPVTPASPSSSTALTPAFDVRASFAPLVFKRTAQTALPRGEQPVAADSSSTAATSSSLMDIDDDGQGIEFAGRKWKGKTAHAVEQEMEKAGDVSVMSYAPDAVYLASRLHGLQRNLEAGGDEARGRRWLDFGDDDHEDAAPGLEAPLASSSPVTTQTDSSRIPATLPPHITDYLRPPTVVEQPASPPRLSAAAKAAALDSRVEIRLLRRSDLEQVRDLHCFHGDSDKVEADHYATSAAFLLRLLVDEQHVCIVAVAKPLPEPEAPLSSLVAQAQANLIPRCPPPSMDMPPSSAPYVFAGQGITSTSPLLKPVDADRRRRGGRQSSRAPSSLLGRVPPVLGSMEEQSDDEQDDGSDAGSTEVDMDDSSERSSSSPPQSAAPTSLFSTSPRDALREQAARTATSTSSGPSLSSPSGMAPKRDYTAATATPASVPYHDMVLAGPTNEVAPPRALRVMVPPAPGANLESETILGVASASINIRPATESLWGDADPTSKPRKEIHLLTLSVNKAERGIGLGGRLLDQVIEEAQRRNVRSAYRAVLGRTYGEVFAGGKQLDRTRIFLEVHPDSSHALALYRSRGFKQVGDRLKGYFRGDVRIPTGVRSLPGGSDALLLERSEEPDRLGAGVTAGT